MKKHPLVFLMLPLLMAACRPKPIALNPSATAPDTTHYPYAIKQADYWEMNPDHKNILAALQLYKIYEKADIDAMSKFFADSIKLYYDGGKFEGTTTAMLKTMAPDIKNMKGHYLKMEDWESVISKDKKEERVTLWYTEHWTDPKGKADSAQQVDNVKFKDGKVIAIYGYSRHFNKRK